MIEALQLGFMKNALWAGLLTSIACGIIGTLVVVNRIVFISGGIAHSTFGGIGLAVFFGFSPIFGALGFALAVAMILAAITVKRKERMDALIGVLWAVGMALGVILIDITPGYNVDLMSYLFGSILAIPSSDIYLMLVVDIIILGLVGYFYRDIMAMAYDEEFAFTVGAPVVVLNFVLLGMIALATVMIIRLVGLILVIALLSIPPYISENHTGSLLGMILLSIILSLIFTAVGLWLSFGYNLSSGATIIMVAAVGFVLDFLYRSIKHKMAKGAL